MTYVEYMASPAWRRLRAEALARDGHRCRLCDGADGLEAHHRRYPPNGQWHLDDLDALTTLCRDCHDLVTGALRARRYAAQAPPAPPCDVARRAPAPTDAARGGLHEPLPDPALPDHRRRTPAHAQRPARGPAR